MFLKVIKKNVPFKKNCRKNMSLIPNEGIAYLLYLENSTSVPLFKILFVSLLKQ